VESRVFKADSEAVYRAVLNSDFLDAIRFYKPVRVLFAVRSAIEGLLSTLWRRPQTKPPEPAALKLAAIPEHGDWVRLGENPPHEIVFGATGRFWAGETVWREIHASDFAALGEPGFAKIACHFLIEPFPDGDTRLTYEVRTAAADPASRRAFLRYWRIVSPMVGFVMCAMLSVIARRLAQDQQSDSLLDGFMPQYDVAERHSIRVSAPAGITLAAARETDLRQSRIVRAIFKAREIVLVSRSVTGPQPAGIVAQTRALGWEVLAEVPGREIVMGAVTQPWAANPVFRAVLPAEFAAHHEPGHVKIAWTLRADPLSNNESLFRTETRAVSCDLEARARFHRYWRFFSPGIVLIRRLMLPLVTRAAAPRAQSLVRGASGSGPAGAVRRGA
jgi:hypothetical protein